MRLGSLAGPLESLQKAPPFAAQEDGAPPSGDTNAWLDLEDFDHHNSTQEAKKEEGIHSSMQS